MATNYPGDIDDFTNPNGTDPVTAPDHAEQHSDANDAIEALQTKVGADSSTVNTTHDYKLSNVSTGDKVASVTGTETLTNKTLTSPTLNTPTINVAGLRDTNGNETIDTPATASAVNQAEIKNAATGDDVEVNAKGDDTNVNIKVKGKGTGVVKLGNAEIEMPNVAGSDTQVLTSDGTGATSWTDKADITDVPEIEASASFVTKAQNTPDLTVAVTKGGFYIKSLAQNGYAFVEYAGGNSPEFTAPTTNPRIDVLSINSSGTLVRTAGTEAATPEAPSFPQSNKPIAQIYNRVGQTSIKDTDDTTNGYIQKDLRPFLFWQPRPLPNIIDWTWLSGSSVTPIGLQKAELDYVVSTGTTSGVFFATNENAGFLSRSVSWPDITGIDSNDRLKNFSVEQDYVYLLFAYTAPNPSEWNLVRISKSDPSAANAVVMTTPFGTANIVDMHMFSPDGDLFYFSYDAQNSTSSNVIRKCQINPADSTEIQTVSSTTLTGVTTISGFFVDSDENYYVIDQSNNELRVNDSTGASVESIEVNNVFTAWNYNLMIDNQLYTRPTGGAGLQWVINRTFNRFL